MQPNSSFDFLIDKQPVSNLSLLLVNSFFLSVRSSGESGIKEESEFRDLDAGQKFFNSSKGRIAHKTQNKVNGTDFEHPEISILKLEVESWVFFIYAVG